MVQVSKLSIYSLGLVAANKPLDTRVIDVTPIEDTSMIDGDINSGATDYKAESKDSDGSVYKAEVKTALTISATWLPMGTSNRMTAPDVRRGELVAIYRFADTDEYWWTTLKDDLHLRKLETVIYAFSGTKDESAKPNSENTYFLEISTHKKLVHFHTSKANGEPFIYDIQINTEEGFIKIQDDDGQFIILDSKERRIIAQNKDKSKVDIDKRNIFIDAPDLIEMRARKIASYSQENLTQANKVDRNSKSETVSSKGIKIYTPLTKHYGDMLVDGLVIAKKGIKG